MYPPQAVICASFSNALWLQIFPENRSKFEVCFYLETNPAANQAQAEIKRNCENF